MSGGQLVVLDRSGRDVKRYPLASGLATLGSDHACDIRVMLAAVQPHHATVVVHANQAVVRNVGLGETLVNGTPISVAALRHGDIVTIADRALRWEYSDPHRRNMPSPVPSLSLGRRGRGAGRGEGRGAARRASGPPPGPRDRAVQLALEMQHRASMPGSTGGKQVAVVQPQRRDTGEQAGNEDADKEFHSIAVRIKNVEAKRFERAGDKSHRSSPQTTRRTQSLNTSLTEADDKSKRKSSARTSPKTLLQNTTKATLWIEQRKTSPRRKVQTPQPPPLPPRRSMPAKKSTPLRLAVLKKAQSARKVRVIKIEAPTKIDHTKQAAIMLMTGHTPRSKLSISPQNQSKTKTSPSFLVKKPSPVRKTPRGKGRQSGRRSKETGSNIGVTPSRGSTFVEDSGQANRRSSKRNSGNRSVTILEITDSTQHSQNSNVRASNISTRSGKSPKKSPSLPSPKKSAMKDLSKKSMRKTESIKFDLSNLEGHQDTNDILVVTNTTQYESDNSMSDGDMTLHYSETSDKSPSSRRSIHSRSNQSETTQSSKVTNSMSRISHSRSSRMLEKLGESFKSTASPSKTLTPESPRARKSIRGSLMIQKAIATPDISDYTRSERSDNTTVASAFRTRTLSPRSNLESYSVVDLVSLDSNDSKSVYNSADSSDTSNFGTPPNGSTRKTRSTINPTLLGSSTPYVGKTRTTRSKSSSNITQNQSTRSSVSTRRSKSLSTPENKHVSVNSTRVSRASRSRSRINDSDLLLLDDTEEDSSPKTSKRNRSTKSTTTNASVNAHSPENQGISTPENRQSPEEARTPVLSIQSLLDSSQSSLVSQTSGRGRRSFNQKRKTIGVLSEPKRRQDNKSKSLGASARKVLLRLSGDSGASSDKTDEGAPAPDNEDTVTPKSAVKLTPEAVKNKHSTAKKPQSKRSIIDDLDRSDIVKQLFNSPVKRKLSQSMTEFSRRQLFEDDDDVVQLKRPTRNTIALTGRTLNDSILNQTEAITPERFVSPIASASNSPNLSRIKRMFKRNTPDNDLRDVRGVKELLRPRRSIRNDLTDVRGVKTTFAKSPRNRLSDVRVKETFVTSPKNDLRRVSGVKSLFQQNTYPKNDLTDVRGVKRVFKRKSPENDLRNVSGVKRILRKTTPKNDLTDVRGVRRMFKQQKQKENYHDVSGVEELFNESNQSANRSETLFDMLVGKPTVRSVYSKTFSTKLIQKPKNRRQKSLHGSFDVTTNNVEEWLEQELQKRLQANKTVESSTSGNTSKNTTKNGAIRELQKLATDTVEGSEPILGSRTRHSSIKKSASEIYSAHTLPIKKRSLVNASLEKPKPQLPIKKRAVVHSTPVKGRINLTMNASELGRVSPIASVDKTAMRDDHNTSSTRTTQIITDEQPSANPPKARAPRKQQTPKKFDVSKVSPKKSPEQQSPPKRATRNRKSTLVSTNTKQRRSSIIITKKAPVMIPQKDKNITRSTIEPIEVSSQASPKAKRATRGKKDASIASPKKTRVRAGRASLVVAKPSPKLKPQPKEKAAEKSQTKAQEKSTRSRKTAVVEATLESPKPSPKTKRNVSSKIAKNVSKTDQTISEKPVQAKRGRKITETEQPVLPKRGRKANATDSSEVNISRGKKKATPVSLTEDKPKTRGKKAESQVSVQTETTARGRGRKAASVVEVKQTKARGRKVEIEQPEEVQTKTRGRKVEAKPVEVQTKTRGKKVETQVKPVEVQTKTRGKRVEPETKPEEIQTKKRGRKPASEILEPVQTKTRGRNVPIETKTDEVEHKTRGGKVKTEPELIEVQTKRGKKVQIDTKAKEVTTRGRGKKTIVQTPPSESVNSSRRNKTDSTVVTETRGRKRKSTAIEEVPSKIPKQAPKRGKKAEVSLTRTTGRQRDISNETKVVSKPEPRTTRGKPKEVKEKKTIETEAKPARGRKPAEPKQEVQEAPRSKRKAAVELSPAKVAAKKPATKAAVKAKPSTPVKIATRATRGKAPAVSPKAVGRSRRR